MAKRFTSNKDESVRMFRNDFLERLTRVHPAVPHLLYLPVVVAMIWLSLRAGMGVGRVALLAGAGLLAWTFTEYVVHRFLFHVAQTTQDAVHEVVANLKEGEPALSKFRGWRQRYYFVAHGVHHDFPSDSRRLVMPPSLSIPLAIAFYVLFFALMGGGITPSVFSGFLVGYLVYDTTHYAVHHFRQRTAIGRFLKKRHFRHHYGDADRDFGVSSPLWDAVFGTLGAGTSKE